MACLSSDTVYTRSFFLCPYIRVLKGLKKNEADTMGYDRGLFLWILRQRFWRKKNSWDGFFCPLKLDYFSCVNSNILCQFKILTCLYDKKLPKQFKIKKIWFSKILETICTRVWHIFMTQHKILYIMVCHDLIEEFFFHLNCP